MAAATTTSDEFDDESDSAAASSSSSSRPPIPLTTIFTPPTTCLDVVTYDGTSFWQAGLSQTGDAGCYPPGFYKIFASWYTPGICPHSWTSVSSVEPLSGFDAFCCPSSYYLHTSDDGILRNVCASLISGDLTNVFSTSALEAGPLPSPHPLITVQKPATSNTVWADVIQIQWQSSDTEIISLMAEASSAAASSSQALVRPTSSIPAATTLPSLSPTHSGGLSTGAKAGIGVGVFLGVIALAAIAGFFFVLGRRKGRYTPAPSQDYKPHYLHEMSHGRHRDSTQPMELDARNLGELDGSHMSMELSAKSPVEGKDATSLRDYDGKAHWVQILQL